MLYSQPQPQEVSSPVEGIARDGGNEALERQQRQENALSPLGRQAGHAEGLQSCRELCDNRISPPFGQSPAAEGFDVRREAGDEGGTEHADPHVN